MHGLSRGRGGRSEAAGRLEQPLQRLLAGRPLSSLVSGGPERVGAGLGQALCEHVRRSADQAPLLLVLDDLQWAMASSIAVFQGVCGCLDDGRILVVANLRDEERDDASRRPAQAAALQRLPHLERLRLSQLDAASVGQLADEVEGSAVSDAAAAEVIEVTGGNPLFVREFLTVLASARRGGGRAHRQPVPTSIRAAVRLRLGAFSAETRETLFTAAVLGSGRALPDLGTRVGRGGRARVGRRGKLGAERRPASRSGHVRPRAPPRVRHAPSPVRQGRAAAGRNRRAHGGHVH